MSQCENYQELISRMVDGDLSAREEADLARHIETCPDCAALFQAFSALSHRIGEDLEESPFDLRDNVMAEIHREEIRRRNRIPTILRSVLSAAACVALIVGVYLGVSITQGKNLVTAAYDAAPAAAEEDTAAAEEEVRAMPEVAPAAAEEAPAEEAADAPTLQANAVEAAPENDHPLLGMGSAAAAPEETTQEETEAEAPAEALGETAEDGAAEAPALEEWELANWDLSLLRELLKGSPEERSAEEMASHAFGRIHLQNLREEYSVLLYEEDGVLYYLDPAEETVYRSALTVDQLRAFLAA